MKTHGVARAAVAAGLSASAVVAQACGKVLIPSYTMPSVHPAWQAQLVAGGLTKPRSLEFDSAGNLLIVESGKGIVLHRFRDNGGTCLEHGETTLLIAQTSLNHGLALSQDGRTLYASTAEAVYAWDYDASRGTVGATPRTIVTGMANDDLVTRTLLISRRMPGKLVVSRGSAEANMARAQTLASGLSQVRAFDLANLTTSSMPYDFSTEGTLLGWGLRNSVGIGEHPGTGGVWAVENSVDGVTRNGRDIHENNPGEELNFLGYLNGTRVAQQGGNFGYPHCFAVWEVTEIPDNDGLSIGDQFARQENGTLTDETCASDYIPPRLTFPAHFAPLDIKFATDGAQAYISFHGSFDKSDPAGYSVASVEFDSATGDPVAARAASHEALTQIMTNPDLSKCPSQCFRPAGLALDGKGRLWMSSDTTGEVFVLEKKTDKPTTTASGTLVTATGKPNDAGRNAGMVQWGWAAIGVVLGLVMMG